MGVYAQGEAAEAAFLVAKGKIGIYQDRRQSQGARPHPVRRSNLRRDRRGSAEVDRLQGVIDDIKKVVVDVEDRRDDIFPDPSQLH